ncbi:MAG TPA: SOS response-associated peptidase [Hyphomicrobiaceae bacterium]|nr:SOS response-associated peptidase [Hyphomicrobiaceae bacterium]
MCSRYSLTSPHEAVRAVFRTTRGHDYPPRYNIAPTQPVAIVRIGADHKRELALVRWGLIPGWVKDPRTFTTLINARAETLLEKPSFRSALRHRRCIVPADAFYEWTGKPGAKQPHLIRPRSANTPMGLAGLWEHWLGADGSEMESMAIITVAANDAIAAIHDRMPAILDPGDYDAWLDTRGVKDVLAADLLQPAPVDLLTTMKIGRSINNVRAEGPDLQRAIEAQADAPDGGKLL